MVLDLETDSGRAGFARLVASADFLFENAASGSLAARELGFASLRAINPHLVYVAITPFGQGGPYAHHLG